jgi:hypothetical protein
MHRQHSSPTFVVLLAIGLTQGCADLGGDGGDETLGITTDALLTTNKLMPNTITPNSLDPNALNPSTLASNALSPSALNSQVDNAIHNPGTMGDISRTFLQYAVGCAFDSTQTFSFTWTDGGGTVYQENYPGQLGLAPAWANSALNVSEQRWVSACLAARTNYYGVLVNISVRGAHPTISRPEGPEKDEYFHEEGALWGDLFSPEPYVRSCNITANDDNSRTRHRECAAGHVASNGSLDDCGPIERQGPCSTLCDPLDVDNLYHPQCLDDGQDPPTAISEVITVFLP